MKQMCEVIQDLLLLYIEGEGSEGTKQFVEAHLAECEECRTFCESLRQTDEAIPQEVKVDKKQEETAVKKSFRKIRRRWACSIAAILMIFPLSLAGILAKNEINKEGICFTNLDEIKEAVDLVKSLERKEYKKVAEQLDFSRDYESLMEAKEYHDSTDEITEEEREAFYEMYEEKLTMTEEEYCRMQRDDFIRRLEAYDAQGYELKYRAFSDAYWVEDSWQIELKIMEEGPKTEASWMVLFVGNGGISSSLGSVGQNYMTDEVLGRVEFE